jgi:alpha-galactosidase
VWDCNGHANQNVVSNPSAKTLVLEGKCFDAYNNQTTAGTPVEMFDCNGQTNQQWNINSNGTITGVQSGLCLDVTGTTNPDGSGLELWSCNGADNQQWTVG